MAHNGFLWFTMAILPGGHVTRSAAARLAGSRTRPAFLFNLSLGVARTACAWRAHSSRNSGCRCPPRRWRHRQPSWPGSLAGGWQRSAEPPGGAGVSPLSYDGGVFWLNATWFNWQQAVLDALRRWAGAA